MGENLRKACEARGWLQEELVDKAGVNRAYVGGIEWAEYNVTILMLLRFAKALGIGLQDALAGIN